MDETRAGFLYSETNYEGMGKKLLGKCVARKKLSDFFGAWPGSDEEALAIRNRLEKERKEFRTKEVTW